MGRYPFIILCLLGGAKETDLIYEGIATEVKDLLLEPRVERN